jgi:hypothetical protein
MDARSQDMMMMRDLSGRGIRRGPFDMGGTPMMGHPQGMPVKYHMQMGGMEMSGGGSVSQGKKKRSHKKKPADMPRRPLSAYNLCKCCVCVCHFSFELCLILMYLFFLWYSHPRFRWCFCTINIHTSISTVFSEERERILKEIDGKDDDEKDDNKETEDKEVEDATKDDKKEHDKEKDEGKTDTKKEGDVGVGDEEESSSKPKALLRPLIPAEKKRRPHRKTHGKISFQQLARMVGERWKKLPDDQRKYYQELAQEDMKRQKQAMEEYYAKQQAMKDGRKAGEMMGQTMDTTGGMFTNSKPVQQPSTGSSVVPEGIQETSV